MFAAYTGCQAERAGALQSGDPNVEIPECKGNGDYDEVQCRGSWSFCVNRAGVRIRGTKKESDEGRLTCPAFGAFSWLYLAWKTGS